MTDTLKPCPFCSGEDLEIEHAPTYMEAHPDVYWILCTDCGARGSEEWTEDKAIGAWNNRAERTCKLLRLENEDVCSFCGYTEEVDSAYIPNNYCPNCGAKVVEE